MRDGEKQSMRTSDRAAAAASAGARSRSESTTLAVAVLGAVAFGVGLGVWVTARLPPPPSPAAPAAARLLPAAPPAPAVGPTPCVGCETSPAHAPAGVAGEAGPTEDPGAATGRAREATPESGASAAGAEPEGVTNSEPAGPATPDPSRPSAWQVGPLPKAGARALARGNVGRGAEQGKVKSSESGAQARPGPCALYASASALSIRLGGAAPLILGGPGQGVRINVNTPHWSEIAVIYEGPAAGHNGWLTYSVRSVGRRPGLYTVRFSTPCGSQTIPVTVK